MLVVVSSSSAPAVPQHSLVTANKRQRPARSPVPGHQRSCVYHQYEKLIPYQEHPSVYTLGAGSTTAHLHFDPESPPHPLHRTERGGEVTYHGPGQWVMYPIVNLKQHTPDMHWYLRSLEQVVIRALEEVSGLKGERIKGCTGVWVNNQKVAAIGVRAQRWVTYHGLALNVTTDLQPFDHIVPCGISTRGVTSVKELTAHGMPDQELLREYQYGLLDAFADVFNVELAQASITV